MGEINLEFPSILTLPLDPRLDLPTDIEVNASSVFQVPVDWMAARHLKQSRALRVFGLT